MFKIKNEKLYFKNIELYEVKSIDAFSDLLIENAIARLNHDIRNHKHKFTKIVSYKLEVNNGILDLKLETYNKKYDAKYKFILSLIINDKYNPIILSM